MNWARQLAGEPKRSIWVISPHTLLSTICPECGTRCDTSRKKRQVRSVDGTLTVDEPVAHCPRCRRGFFPPPGDAGL